MQTLSENIRLVETHLPEKKGDELKIWEKILIFLKEIEAGKENVQLIIFFPFPEGTNSWDVVHGTISFDGMMMHVFELLNNLVPRTIGSVSFCPSGGLIKDPNKATYSFEKSKQGELKI